ncbi:unnamed protein product [Paramecium pentaurelia]|uniref:Transmembrane protein n=1 Tax=Paramecium pentaurelia TaxID=43138 RepID=A0A8S1Y9L1_9CILI|nr:unnamed protein product [Paramecium pentaurelia]
MSQIKQSQRNSKNLDQQPYSQQQLQQSQKVAQVQQQKQNQQQQQQLQKGITNQTTKLKNPNETRIYSLIQPETNRQEQNQEVQIVHQEAPPKFNCLKSRPDPILDWEVHKEKQLYSEFQEFIESRYLEVKRSSSIYKYYAKIGLQIFIYILNVLELIFTLSYKSYNNISDQEIYYLGCYYISIISCALLHSATWMYTYKFRQVAKKSMFIEISYYIFYLFMGGLSFFKIAPFIYYFNRDQSIKQFSFSEINKYLILDGEDKFRNPSILFKQRTKPVNIFRDLIFHRIALLSMMITMCLQTFPQLFIQGFYNTEHEWDGFNVFSYLLLVSNLIYYLLELQFIVFTTTYRQIQTELQFKLKKIKLKFIQETKQLLKSDKKYLGFVKSFYFHIDPTTFSNYQKKRCMVQIITFLTRYKKFQNIQFLFIDQYDEITLQYLANCFKLIQVDNISLLYKDVNKLKMLQDTFLSKQFPKLKLEQMQDQNIDQLWVDDKIDTEAEEQKIQEIQFIENPKINSGWQAVAQNQKLKREYIEMSYHFTKLIPDHLRKSVRLSSRSYGTGTISSQINIVQTDRQESQIDIAEEAKNQFKSISKEQILEESLGYFKCLLAYYKYFETWGQLNQYQATMQSLQSFLNGGLQIVSLVYIGDDPDKFQSALIVLTVINPVIQMLSFTVFQHRVFKTLTIQNQIQNVLLFAIFNFLKVWDIVMIAMYYFSKKFFTTLERNFSAEGYIKFKSYASKFQGSLPISVFQYETVKVDSKSILAIKQLPFYQAVMWRTSVEEALNKIPQFFIYILALSSSDLSTVWAMSFFQQIKEGILAVKDILEVVIKDFFIPALILSTVSVEQFFQSMLYLSSISNQMLLEYPKSFQIMSKVDEKYLKQKCTFKINMEHIDFSNYKEKKKEKMLAQFRYVLASIQNILEIDKAQRLFCMGPEINDFVRCLKVSPIYQLKLNFNLDEVNPLDLPHINAFIKYCPPQLQFLQIQVEATEEIKMPFCVERKTTLKAFSYSYFQIIQQYKDTSQVVQQKSLDINKDFLELDRYDFEQFYFEIAGNLNLEQCSQLFGNFKEMKIFQLSINNNSIMQNFKFSDNIKSKLDILDITFENIRLEFQQFPFSNLKTLKMNLKRCEFNKTELYQSLVNLKNGESKIIYIDLSQCSSAFTKIEHSKLVRVLEQNKFDVTIII